VTHGQCGARPTVISSAAGHHRPKLYYLVTEAHVCELLAQGCYLKAERPEIEPNALTITPPGHVFRMSIYEFSFLFAIANHNRIHTPLFDPKDLSNKVWFLYIKLHFLYGVLALNFFLAGLHVWTAIQCYCKRYDVNYELWTTVQINTWYSVVLSCGRSLCNSDFLPCTTAVYMIFSQTICSGLTVTDARWIRVFVQL